MIRLEVCYEGLPSFNKSGSLDEKIETAVGKEMSGSGGGLSGRDIGFNFRSRQDAVNASQRVRRLAKKLNRKLICSIR